MALASGALFCSAGPVWAAPPVVGAEKPASTPLYQAKPGSQHTSAAAWNGLANKYLVVWVDGDTIRGELVSTAGARTAPTYVFSIPTGGSPSNLDLAVRGTHLFLLVWEQNGAVRGARILDDTPLGPPFLISDELNFRGQPTRQGEPAVASDGTNFLVTWSDGRRNETLPAHSSSDGYDIFAARISGNIFASPLIDPLGFPVAEDGTLANVIGSSERYIQHDQTESTVAWDGTNYLVAWAGQAAAAASTHIRARFATPAGAVSGSIFAVTDTASPPERNPDIVWNAANAVYLLVWTTGFGTGTVQAARVNAAGSVLDTPPEQFSPGPADRVRVAANGSNSYTVVWDNGSDIHGLIAVRISFGGPFQWLIPPSSQVVAAEAGGDIVPSLTAGDGTNLLVAWTAGAGGTDANVHARRVNAGATPLDASPLVLSSSANPQELPSLAWSGSTGSYLAAWKDRRPPTSSFTYDAFRARLNAAGDLLDGSGLLMLDDVSNTFRAPAMARGETTFLVTWAHDFEVYGQVMDASGAPIGGTIPIDTPDYNGVQPEPDISWNGATYLVVWRYYDGGFDQGIRAKRVSEGGDILDSAPISVAADGNGVTGARVASDGGNWLVTWSQLAPGTASDAFARRVDRDGAVLGAAPITVASAPDDQQPSGIAWDGDRYMVVWEDDRAAGPTTSDVYAGRVSEGGTPLDGTGIPVATAPVGSGGREPAVVANGENFVVAWRTYANDIRAARMSGAGTVLDSGGVLVGGGGQALAFPALVASSPGRVAIAYARTAPESLYGGVGRMFLRFVDEDVPVAADTTPPSNPSLSSSSHQPGTISSDDTVAVEWTGATDGGSGIDGYSYIWDPSPTAMPPSAKNADGETSAATSPPLATGSWYFHLRTRDKAGNWNNSAVSIGPFVVDTTPPGLALTAKATAKLGTVRSKGYAFRARCSEGCALVAQLRLSPKLAKRLKLAQVAAQVKRSLPAGQTRSLVLALKPRAKRKLGTLASVRLTLVVTVTDAVGNKRTIRKAVTLRR